MLEPSQIFADRYRIVRHVADGGMGAVFEAEHLGTEARVALKLLWPHVVKLASARERFELEARVAARINCEHIVKVLDAGFDSESRSPYLVMELLVGSTLAARVLREGPLSAATTVALMRQVARGLDAAHGYVSPGGAAQPIVHRDLKPENLFVSTLADGSLHVKILDFGIAKVLSETTDVSQEVRGTPLYMAFEQVAGEPLSPQTDIWAFGLITYYVLTGRRYWPAANKPAAGVQALFAEILSLPLPLASERIRDDGIGVSLPLAFDAWLFECIDRNPGRRFASASQAVDALESALEEAGSVRSGLAEGPRRGSRRHPELRWAATATFDGAIASAAASHSLPAVASERATAARARPRWGALALVSAGATLAMLGVTWRFSGRGDSRTSGAGQQPQSQQQEQVPPVPATEPAPATPRVEREAAPAQATQGSPQVVASTEALKQIARAPVQPTPRPRDAPPPRTAVPARPGEAPTCAYFDPYTGRCSPGKAPALPTRR